MPRARVFGRKRNRPVLCFMQFFAEKACRNLAFELQLYDGFLMVANFSRVQFLKATPLNSKCTLETNYLPCVHARE
jgi:hypothetical protein